MERLIFSQNFPFTENAREFLKESKLNPEDVSETIIKRAALIILRANSNQEYSIDLTSASREMLQNEIIAFPIAKLIISSMKTPNIKEKFSLLIKKKTFTAILQNPDPKKTSLSLADDFKLEYLLSEEKEFFVEIKLTDYLNINFVDDESKLVNKHVSKGIVYLTLNDFARFLSEKAYKKVFDSLPIEKKFISKIFVDYSKTIDSQLMVIEKKNFDLKIEGKIDPNLFPPCMQVLYSDQASGKKLSYMARLVLASFLFQLGMQKQELLSLFSKSPDYKKHIAEYHIDRIYQKKLSAPACKKIAEYGLRVKACDGECKSNHPVRYYISKLRVNNRIKKENSIVLEKKEGY
jgi:DNA primase large subunit